jgi:hypothetical protein
VETESLIVVAAAAKEGWPEGGAIEVGGAGTGAAWGGGLGAFFFLPRLVTVNQMSPKGFPKRGRKSAGSGMGTSERG